MCKHCVKNIKEENTILIEKESHSRTLSVKQTWKKSLEIEEKEITLN